MQLAEIFRHKIWQSQFFQHNTPGVEPQAALRFFSWVNVLSLGPSCRWTRIVFAFFCHTIDLTSSAIWYTQPTVKLKWRSFPIRPHLLPGRHESGRLKLWTLSYQVISHFYPSWPRPSRWPCAARSYSCASRMNLAFLLWSVVFEAPVWYIALW